MNRSLIFLGLGFALLAPQASAEVLMGSKGWSPPQNANRAAIASLMMQHEQMRNPLPNYAGAIFTCGGSGGGGSGGTGGTGGGSGGAGGGTTSSSATGNNNCVIVVGSKGTVVDVDQVSDGNQSANSQSDATTSAESLSNILEHMQ